jgi:acetyltransferase-like isoleucine patch superfamily enzyme
VGKTDLKIYSNVELGKGWMIESWVIIGVPPSGRADGEIPTIIGKGAIIRSHTVIYAGNSIGEHLRTGHGVMIREMNEIGNEVSIGTHSIIEHHVKVGNNVRVHSNVFIPEFSIIEEGAWIGPGTVLTNARYPLARDAKKRLCGPRISAGAIIGANVTILPGIVVGRCALVGAGAVVTNDVPDNMIVVGNPARVIKDISSIPEYKIR